jgi:uncharacterized membrane protein
MATDNQFGGLPVTGGDLSLKNYSVTDIAAGKAVFMSDVAAEEMGCEIPATSDTVERTIGITMEIIKAGKVGRVRALGAAVCVANDTIVRGNAVQIDTASGHEGEVKLLASGKTQLGRALNSAVAGGTVLVWVNVASTVSSA